MKIVSQENWITTPGAKTAIFSLFQEKNAWVFLEHDADMYESFDVDDYYKNNLDFAIQSHARYAEAIGADYYHFKKDFVDLVEQSLPNLTELKMYIQYYEFSRFILLDRLSKQYDKVLHLDLDIIPIKNKNIFDSITKNNSIYVTWFKSKECPFYKDMEGFIKGLGDTKYKYKGHTNTGAICATGNGAKQFLNTLESVNKFIDGVTKFYYGYVGTEHIFMYQVGRGEDKYNLVKLDPKWNDTPFNPRVRDSFNIRNDQNMLHFAGREGKKYFEKNKELIVKLSEGI